MSMLDVIYNMLYLYIMMAQPNKSNRATTTDSNQKPCIIITNYKFK